MNIFDRLTKDQISMLRKDTSNFFLGAPEAEAESTNNSKLKLTSVFKDFLDVLPKLNSEKFIISGRKGSGKSAIAEHIYFLANNEADYFCDFIKKSDIDIEKITQISSQSDSSITQELLIEWIILVKFINQLVQDENITKQKGVQDLKIFLKKNSGFVEIKSNQIQEVIQNKGWEVNVDYFKRFLSTKFGNRYDIKSGKAPFYKLIPHLKETVKDLLNNNNNNYILIFDDLDIGFSSKNSENIETILNILRIVKDYNISFFGRNGFNAKIILLLREDISRFLYNRDADTAKIFSSYDIPLSWYEHVALNEDDLKIKQFINQRIILNFTINKFNFNQDKPWESFIEEDESYKKSSFKYVIDHTLIRPRDLILFFKPLSELKFGIPLRKQDLNILIGKYAIEFVKELKNELAAHYEPNDIDSIFNAFNNCFVETVTYEAVEFELKKTNFSGENYKLLELLFDLSIIGNLSESGTSYFKYWEKDDQTFTFNRNNKIIPHFTLRNYCMKSRIQ